MQSETIGAIAAALAKAQGDMKPAAMDRTNYYKMKYATLTSLWESARAALSTNGLAVTQTTDFDGNGDTLLVTTLLHASGEWIGSVYPIVAKDNSAQALGGAITYARRYTLSALLGLTSDDDDDGETATHGVNNAPQKKEAQPQHRTPPAATSAPATSAPAAGKAPNGNGGAGNGQSVALKAFMARGAELFGLEWVKARPWLIDRWTTKETPDNVRKSASDLTDGELRELRKMLDEYAKGIVKQWKEYREEHRAELDAVPSVADAPELNPDALTVPE